MGIGSSEVPEENPNARSSLIKEIQINRQMIFNTIAFKEAQTRSCLQSKNSLTPIKSNVYSSPRIKKQTPKTAPRHSLRKFGLDQRGAYVKSFNNSILSCPVSIQTISEEEKVVEEGQSGDAHKGIVRRLEYARESTRVEDEVGKKADKVSSLPPNAMFEVACFAIKNFRTLMYVSHSLGDSIMDSFDVQFNELERKFANKYISHLLYKQATTSYSRIKSCEIPGTRVDRLIRFEPLESTRAKTITFGYSFRYKGDMKNRYSVMFSFDSVGTGRRVVWAYLNECNVSLCATVVSRRRSEPGEHPDDHSRVSWRQWRNRR
eukprot:TRINITY_DN9508_c0_g5_i1.p1 TRINITY_DN9508_c0_g5~~TRINITY_DN9508_c0_g5_i1.p1  ORF type:complete len:319 (+),score=61.43 TRINITY_DN9508_c0_g5_i1:124-1080(+)